MITPMNEKPIIFAMANPDPEISPEDIFAVRDDAGDTHCYRIVGPDESDAKTYAISIDSALARALLKKRIDDEVLVKTSGKTVALTILSIRYENQE